MEIQQQIKQSAFATPQQKVFINLVYTFNFFTAGMKEQLAPYSLLYQHFNVLKILKGAKGKALTHSEVLDVMLDKTRDLTRLIDKLQELGYVNRKPNPQNRRSVFISITPAGTEVTLEIEKKINDWIMSEVKISDEEAESLSQLLDKMRG